MADPVRRQISEESSAWRIRLFLSVLFFLTFYVMEKQGISIGGLTSEKIYETVCDSTKGFDFTFDIPYTLND